MRIFGFGSKKSKEAEKPVAPVPPVEKGDGDKAPDEQTPPEAPAAASEAKEEGQSLLSPERVRGRWAKGLLKTREMLSASIGRIFLGAKKMSPELLEELEEALILADVGFDTVEKIVAKVNEDLQRKELSRPDVVKNSVKEAIVEILSSGVTPNVPSIENTKQRPYVSLIVGVNGTGKTTTIAKLAHRYKQMRFTPILAAADTFRAAAIEQLTIWAERAGVDIIAHKEGGSPAAVVFDAVAAANSGKGEMVIVDTAGRLHTKKNLMAELAKIRRVAATNAEGAPHEILLVLDATSGQNAISQARQFSEWLEGLTGIVLTKIDGTAKGGVVVTIADELSLPILFLGTGEKIEDLVRFDARAFVNALIE
ncbi:MAG: signal recognition particle-docking protein FtsY [Candidatus Coatesbacteria bacterium]|nr:signal recognition particle-docking protein FtsY [Candidatus Coatesbacteria bacterium]